LTPLLNNDRREPIIGFLLELAAFGFPTTRHKSSDKSENGLFYKQKKSEEIQSSPLLTIEGPNESHNEFGQ
jgi:hypothetical protein